MRYSADDPAIDRRLLSEGAAWIVRDILEANQRPGYSPGTFDQGSRPRVAWKTGTSYGFRDAWAVGATRQYTVAVWIGRPDGTPLPGQYGAVTALPLMFQVVDSLPRSAVSTAPEPPPATVTQADVCWPLGLAFDAAHADLCHQKYTAWVLNGVIPPTFAERDATTWSAGLLHIRVDARSGLRLSAGCESTVGAPADATHPARTGNASRLPLLPQEAAGHDHVKEVDIARWPALAYPWLSRDLRRRASLPPLAKGCAPNGIDRIQSIRIEGIADNAAIARAPNSDKPATLRLRALGTEGDVIWLINGKFEGQTRGGQAFQHAFESPGEQIITALADSGNYAQLHVRVLR